MSVKTILDRVKHRETKKDQWVAVCPAHSDNSPSLHIKEKDDGRVLIHCKAGCGANEILSALGLEFGDLFPDTEESFGAWRPKVSRSSLDDFVCEIWEADRRAGKPATASDKARYREALMRGGKRNGFLDELVKNIT